ncbi:acyl-ACP--UDP-N-acetylglucosamine O-acyltransferase [Thermodesulfobacteriota bacterium]
MEIHSSALVSPHAELAPGVKIGPYSKIGDHVSIGRDTVIDSHVVIEGSTKIGERNNIYPFVLIGSPPQDVGYNGEDTRVVIGNDNIIREYATINRATTKQDWVTIMGNDNFLMAYTHIAHDCVLGNKIIMSNAATLGGHTVVGDHVTLGGLVAAHQFVRIGAYAFIGGLTGVPQDIPPFMIAAGHRAKLYGPNQNGLRRQGFSKETINGLKKAYKIIWRESGRFSEGISRVRNEIDPFPELEMLLDFISASKRGVAR